MPMPLSKPLYILDGVREDLTQYFIVFTQRSHPRKSVKGCPVFQAWTNKQRVLILGSRGIGHRDRHLMDDLRDLMPHCRRESKVRP